MPYPWLPDTVPVLRGERLTLRELREDDLPAWFGRLSDPEAAKLAGDPVATSMQTVIEALAYHRDAFLQKEGVRWAIVLDALGSSVGSVGLGELDEAARVGTIGAAIGRDHWSQGIATDAGRLVVDYGLGSLGLNRVEAVVLEKNARVIRVVEKLGFTARGRVPDERAIGGEPSLLYSIE